MFVSGKSFIVQSHLLAILYTRCTPSTDGNGGGGGNWSKVLYISSETSLFVC